MARNKSGGNVGQPARDALNSLSDALDAIGLEVTTYREPGEFTVADAVAERGGSYEMVRTKLAAAVKAGKLVSRVGREDGKSCIFYRLP